MKYSKYLFFSFLTLLITWGCKPAFYNEITVVELEETINFLASDSLKGRYPGTPEDSILRYYIIEKMDASGMVPLGGNGFQKVNVENGFVITSNNKVYTDNAIISANGEKDLKVFGFSASDTITGELVLIKNIASLTNLKQGKILMTSFPADLPGNDYDAYNKLRSICLKASDEGASALVFIHEGPIPTLNNSKRLTLPIPVVSIDIKGAELLTANDSYKELNNIMESAGDKVIYSGLKISIETEVIANEVATYNTISELKGSDVKLSDQYVIIGAHHDHLGMGGRGSSSRRQDTIATHYGADDNASGVAGVIELSQNLMSRSPSRSFVFMTFAAEEMGLFGSKKFASDPTIDLSKVQLMINLDMIGRLNEDRQLQIGGIGTSPIFQELLDSINTTYNFSMAYSNAGYGPSDHSSFYAKDIPVLFISTGAHPDYHTPSDTPDKINYEGMVEVLNYVSDLATSLANPPKKIEFTEAGPKESSGSRGRMGMVTFGLMPDVMYDGNDGMPVSFVTDGKPAAIGGMKGGDIITAVDGKSVGNVQDYMTRLSDLKEGQSVVVTVKREEKQIELLLKL